ncbi:MAG: response regulator [Endozoicomonas sp.]
MEGVLMVADSQIDGFNPRNLDEWLEKYGYMVLTSDNGADGVALCKEEQPDAVLMDIVMPGLNGFQATRQLSKDASTGHIPIIIVTTKDQETDRVWGMRQGAKNYLTKPIKENILLETINEVLSDVAA